MADSNLGAGKYWKSWKDMRKVAILFVTFTLLYLLHTYLFGTYMVCYMHKYTQRRILIFNYDIYFCNDQIKLGKVHTFKMQIKAILTFFY